MGRRISKEFLHPSILEGVNNKIGNLDSLETDAKGNMVQAINELVEKLDNSAEIENGKELIANAVGEPLTAEESFDEMSNDINSLLSQFKTNMMNNGVVVESGDKFKALIDKIATMVEEGEGKGVKFASGDTIEINYASRTDYGTVKTTINTNLNFTPNYVFVCVDTLINSKIHKNVVFSNLYKTQIAGGTLDGTTVTVTDIRQESFKISVLDSSFNLGAGTWYAIGIGEEDTTLRDSLADILENKGVDVTEEDDMASLITKVDSISGGLDIISATELPTTGRENQICVITNNPVDNFMITGNSAESNNDKIVIYNSTGTSNYNTIKNNITYSYNISRVRYQSNELSSYYWGDNQWNRLTVGGSIVLFERGEFLNTDITGGFGTATGTTISGSNFVFSGARDATLLSTTTKKINFSKFKTLKVTLYTTGSSASFLVGSFMETYAGKYGASFSITGKTFDEESISSVPYSATEISINVSGWTTGYLGFFRSAQSLAPTVYITKITLEA